MIKFNELLADSVTKLKNRSEQEQQRGIQAIYSDPIRAATCLGCNAGIKEALAYLKHLQEYLEENPETPPIGLRE